ncbi:hypothetical protein A9K55_001337 [Cordyceps militaris]|uniref:Uncharacterized protein n=1 Tax=Cordyceps militaris TaxID=73501 RepID=A0A2H4SSP7_CORMI|nr:hypothetical protein A9K55_001337 [Cordyceps militaris]
MASKLGMVRAVSDSYCVKADGSTLTTTQSRFHSKARIQRTPLAGVVIDVRGPEKRHTWRAVALAFNCVCLAATPCRDKVGAWPCKVVRLLDGGGV